MGQIPGEVCGSSHDSLHIFKDPFGWRQDFAGMEPSNFNFGVYGECFLKVLDVDTVDTFFFKVVVTPMKINGWNIVMEVDGSDHFPFLSSVICRFHVSKFGSFLFPGSPIFRCHQLVFVGVSVQYLCYQLVS